MILAVDGFNMSGPTRGMARFGMQLGRSFSGEVIYLRPDGRLPFPIWEQVALMRAAKKKGASFLLCPYNTSPYRLSTRIPVISVVHDLIFLDKTIQSSIVLNQRIGRAYRRLVVPHTVRSAHRIVTVSEFSKSQLVTLLRVPEERISIIPNGIEDAWFNRANRETDPGQNILTVAGEAPSKNLTRLIEAFGLLRRDRAVRLQVVGVKPQWHAHFYEVAASCGVGDAVDFFHYLPEQSLIKMFRAASLYVCASLSEGFGIPVVQAMASGTPIAVSRATSLPEIAGGAAIYFDPWDTTNMRDVMAACLEDEQGRESRRQIGMNLAENFHEARIMDTMKTFWTSI